MRVLILFLVVFSGCAASQKQLAGAHLARFETLDVVLANARSSTCLQGLEPIPATVIDVGIFKNVPYQSFSNGLLELNAYGDPSNLVALEAGTKERDEALKRCIVQFLSWQTLSASDGARVDHASLTSHAETIDGLTVETTTADAVAMRAAEGTALTDYRSMENLRPAERDALAFPARLLRMANATVADGKALTFTALARRVGAGKDVGREPA